MGFLSTGSVRGGLAAVLLRVAHWAAGRHFYLSTSCQHGHHEYCASATGSNGETEWTKRPGRCKFCPSACICRCHGPG